MRTFVHLMISNIVIKSLLSRQNPFSTRVEMPRFFLVPWISLHSSSVCAPGPCFLWTSLARISSKTRAVSSRVELARSRAALSAQCRRRWGYPDHHQSISQVCNFGVQSHLPYGFTLNLKLRLEEDFRCRAANNKDVEPKPRRATWMQVWVWEQKTNENYTCEYRVYIEYEYVIFTSYSDPIYIMSISLSIAISRSLAKG